MNDVVLPVKDAAKVTLTADSSNTSTEKSMLVAEFDTIVADDEETSTLKLTLVDTNNNPIAGQQVKFNSSLANSDFDEVKDNGNGLYAAKLKGKTAGISIIKVTVNYKLFVIESKVNFKADSKRVELAVVRLDDDITILLLRVPMVKIYSLLSQ
ncbi:MAG: Ig-like domain-containing protein [Arsenophonus endosymbiont of Dermacentor nuttalli]